MTNGPGFWLKFDSPETLYLTGVERLEDTISIMEGWNIIGSVSIPVTINAMNSEPSGIIASTFYGYDQAGGIYHSSDTLQPGKGYWVKSVGDGTLILSTILESEPPQAPTLSYPPDGAGGMETAIEIGWRRSLRATSYDLQVSTDSAFSDFFYNQTDLTGLTQEITGLNNNTKYYWRVSASNSNGPSGWSLIRSFTTVWICGNSVEYAAKQYNTVQIGEQCWLKENLDVGMMIAGGDTAENNGVIEKYCYNDLPANCEAYGGLYHWSEAMQYSTTEGARGICPVGWHIATYDEYQTLLLSVSSDANALKEIGQGTGGGAGTNTSGYSALLSGVRGDNGHFYSLGIYAYFWRSTGSGPDYAYNMNLNYYDDKTGTIIVAGRMNGFSVRCLKD